MQSGFTGSLIRSRANSALLGEEPEDEEAEKVEEAELANGFAEGDSLAEVPHGEEAFHRELDELDELGQIASQFRADAKFMTPGEQDEGEDDHGCPGLVWAEGVAQLGSKERKHHANSDGPDDGGKGRGREIELLLFGLNVSARTRASLHTGRLAAHLGLGDSSLGIRHSFVNSLGDRKAHPSCLHS